ncbi:MAG: ABC transporter permease [Deltaproteobacteria bacterium]|nr:ABC transporter permease [Deltaproteobacteria bacterium]
MPVILSTDLIVYFVVSAALYFGLSARNDGRAREVWFEIRKNKLALASMCVLCLYGAAAMADSIRFRDALVDEKGAPVVSSDGAVLYSPQPLSLLDRALPGMRGNSEKTYSAPFSDRLFVKETMETPDGRVVRDYPLLKHPHDHALGTDRIGADILFTALKGVRTAIVIGTGATVVIIPFAIFFGVIAGYFGGFADDAVQYVYTTLASIPGVLLIVSFMLLFGSRGYQGGVVAAKDAVLAVFVPNDRLFWLCLILGITSWTDLCRLIRGETLKLREMDYVQASLAFGSSRMRVIYTHIVPNLMHLVLITFVLQFSGLVLAESVLSYIGIGVGPQTASWGNMINASRLELSREPVVWWNLLGAFVFMFALVLPANVFGDAVRDALDPRLRNR